jgi:hypothetical protein
MKMAKSGCVCISFGMESGNQRILDLIDKGTRVDYMAKTMKHFASAGVAVQLMAFTDFPTETDDEQHETFKFVEDNREYWSTGGVGKFMLTGTSMIAQNPQKFGISLIEIEGADVARTIAYKTDSETSREILHTEDGDVSFDDNRGAFPEVPDRPWAGGTDSLHSMIYYDAYGRDFFKHHNLTSHENGRQEKSDEDLMGSTIYLPGKIVESLFDISTIVANRDKFGHRVKELMLLSLEPTHTKLRKWQSRMGLINRGENPTYWIISGNQCARLAKGLYQIILMAVQEGLIIRDILESVSPTLASQLLNNLRALEKRDFLIFIKP